MNIAFAATDTDIRRCFPVMQPLWPHLQEAEFVSRVRRQQDGGGDAMAFLENQDRVRQPVFACRKIGAMASTSILMLGH